jgi:hypothetical protein
MYQFRVSGFSAAWPEKFTRLRRAASLIGEETLLEPKFSNGNLSDIDCGSGFQPRSYDDSNKATFFRGWKPLPREIDVNLMALTPDLLKFHTRCQERQAQ